LFLYFAQLKNKNINRVQYRYCNIVELGNKRITEAVPTNQ